MTASLLQDSVHTLVGTARSVWVSCEDLALRHLIDLFIRSYSLSCVIRQDVLSTLQLATGKKK